MTKYYIKEKLEKGESNWYISGYTVNQIKLPRPKGARIYLPQ